MPKKKTHAQLKVETLEISKLKDHPSNPRVHPDQGSESWNALKKSIENVYFDPLVWNKRNGMLVSGHLRKKILIEMGIERVDCVVIDVDDANHKALLMRANRNDGMFDNTAVVNLIQSLDGTLDLSLTGFNSTDLAGLVQQMSNFPAPTTPFTDFDDSAVNADGSVNFRFGAFKTKVRRDVYEKFSNHVVKVQGKDKSVLLDKIISDLL